VEDVSDEGTTITVRWALMKETPEQMAARLNRWLEQVEEGNTVRAGSAAGICDAISTW
jgi:hypothetical protein